MTTQKYTVNQFFVETILAWVESGEIAIPEIQRPFVWKSSKVRDLMDSLYNGYPVGYLITWRNPDVKLKDGSSSEGKKVLIDGQQRITAMMAAILGKAVINEDYKKIKIKIAFHPIEKKFEVVNPAILKDVNWIPDIAPIITGEARYFEVVSNYMDNNPDANRSDVEDSLENLRQIQKKQLGLIELVPDLDIEVVNEVFIRINSQGVALSQADFAMSKIAVNEEYGGPLLRKCIDYFCHLAVAPEFYPTIKENDTEFAGTEYFQKVSWLKNENDDLYDPDYKDLIRVAFTYKFSRGKLSDLVSLLSGRNFETRTYEDEIAKESFSKLKEGVLDFINETSFKKFVMIIKSAGFIDSGQVRSQNTLNFAYILYLKLRSLNYDQADIGRFVRRWFVLSILTGRYSSSPESKFDFDIKSISKRKFEDFLHDVESAELSEAFWNASLIQSMNTSVASSPFFNVYLASQVKANDKGFLSGDITVNDLISHRGDIHHIFPRDYLKKNGLKRGQYNQIANYVYMQSEINIKVGNKAPNVYFSELKEQCLNGTKKYGGICNLDQLNENLAMNCIPENVFSMSIEDYDDFLELRRKLISKKIKKYYFSL
jgi:hypothetical protein